MKPETLEALREFLRVSPGIVETIGDVDDVTAANVLHDVLETLETLARAVLESEDQ